MQQDSTKNFYKRLKDKFYKAEFTKKLFDLIFVNPEEDTVFKTKDDSSFWNFKDKIIGNIQLKKLAIFGPTLEDTTQVPKTDIERFANRVIPKTRDHIIFNNLLFSKGDSVVPEQLRDSERIIRRLPYILDAQIKLQERDSSDTVDVLVLTQDIFPITIGLSFSGMDHVSFLVNHLNLFGIGHELDNQFLYTPNQKQKLGYDVVYSVPNIRGTFITSELQYRTTYNEKIKCLHVFRRFITPDINYAGGIQFANQRILKETLSRDNTTLSIPYKLNYQKFWLGRAFKIEPEKENDRFRFILTGRVANKNFTEHPVLTADTNRSYHSYTFLLGSMGFSNRKYYKDRFVYGFGKTEDISCGEKLNIIYGYQFGEFISRPYLRFDLSKGGYLTKLGYLYSGIKLGGFLHDNTIEQGVINISINYFTELLSVRRQLMRHFAKVDYLVGFNMFEEELLDIHGERGLRGLGKSPLRGTQRLKLSLETVLFSPRAFFGFKVASFGFVDAVMVNDISPSDFKEGFYPGIGLGVRIRNEHLSFKTFQISLAYYPTLPSEFSKANFDVRKYPFVDPVDFDIGEPMAIPFE
ncbi:MAG: hypothetical protein MI674_00520 [Cytophagales bacterium]|nr:hypothetical protein [Cytophagales bacterium]